MKKLLLILLSAVALTAMAQSDVKRVAILETVDKQGTVPYLKQLMFRSNLTTAITNTAGYEGYDRADLKEILGEQNFQRTGLVSDADIKKIGEFTGAKYVLIAEAVIDGNDMFITAKIIDVETARVLRNSNQLMGTSAAEMQTGSQKVASDLLGVSTGSSAHQQVAYNKPTPQASVYQAPAPPQAAAKSSSKGSVTASAPAVSTSTVPVSRAANEYVDLGLPSGTKWKASNESCGLVTYQQAISMFGSNLPTSAQLTEIATYCAWTWTGNGYNVTGPNNETIYFPAEGYKDVLGVTYFEGKEGLYWSSTDLNANMSAKQIEKSGGMYASLILDKKKVNVGIFWGKGSCSIRLVQ